MTCNSIDNKLLVNDREINHSHSYINLTIQIKFKSNIFSFSACGITKKNSVQMDKLIAHLLNVNSECIHLCEQLGV